MTLVIVPKGTSHHEAKLVCHSILSFLNQCSAMAQSAGKVYFADIDVSYNAADSILDPSVASPTSPNDDLFRFNTIQLYSATWDGLKINYKFAGESYEIPIAIGAYCNLADGDRDHLYFKPDGSVSIDNNAGKFIISPSNNVNQYYALKFAKNYSNFKITSFKD